MIYPKKNFLIKWFFHTYIRFIVTRNFKAINFDLLTIDTSASIMLVANHYSWWDGFVLYWLNERLFKKNFHIMILEETVQKFFFMKYLGAFSIQKKSRDMIESINYAAALLEHPENLVLIFPQGKLFSNFVNVIHFEQGLQRILAKINGNFKVIFAATFTENFTYRRPSVNIFLEQQDATTDSKDVAYNYQYFYNDAKARQGKIIY